MVSFRAFVYMSVWGCLDHSNHECPFSSLAFCLVVFSKSFLYKREIQSLVNDMPFLVQCVMMVLSSNSLCLFLLVL